MAAGWRQVALLLWKDFLIRKRKLITIGGVVWAIVVILSLYIVRSNVDNQDYASCQYPARALPSAGMLNFLQSFVCSINNECSPLDKYQEVPSYENARLTQLQRQFAPLLYNESVLEIASSVPDALKLVATLARVVDDPTFVDISKNGLLLRDIFVDPILTRKYLSTRLDLEENVIEEIMQSELSFQGILAHSLDVCNVESLSRTFLVNDTNVLDALVMRICPLPDSELQEILMHLVPHINFNKYIKMIGNMYSKLNGDNRITQLGDTLLAILRMTQIKNFVPPELLPLFTNLGNQENGFSYFNLTIVNKLMDIFEPTFGNTEAYKSLRGVTDSFVASVQWLYKFFRRDKFRNNIQATNVILGDLTNKGSSNFNISEDINNAFDLFEETLEIGASIDDVFNMLTKASSVIINWLPKKTQHDVLFYSTLLAKLIEGANQVVITNVKIEEIMYRVSQSNLVGVNILADLPPTVVGKVFDALTDAERTQVLTSKINFPGQMFCDTHKISVFFRTSTEESNNLKTKLCKDPWKNYVTDLIKAFGIFEVRTNINTMASLLIQETLGKDTNDQLYSIDKDLAILKELIETVMNIKNETTPALDWKGLFNVTDDSEFVKIVKEKSKLRNQILVTVHGALGREVVRQNPILEAKITPILLDATEILTALNTELESTPKKLVNDFKKMYYDILHTMLLTLLKEDKTFKSLSTSSIDIFCNGQDNNLVFPEDVQKSKILNILCSMSQRVENALDINSVFGKMLKKQMDTNKDPMEEVNWNELINALKNLYKTLEGDYPYIFDYAAYGMNNEQKLIIQQLIKQAKSFWFNRRNISKGIHLSVKICLRALDLVDKKVFNLNSTAWLQMKQSVDSLNGLIVITDEMVKLVTAFSKNESYNSKVLPTITVTALKQILPNIPKLMVETVDIIIEDDTNTDEVISLLNTDPAWPCSDTSLSEILNMSLKAAQAVKGFEMIICMNRSLQQEWAEHLQAQKVRKIMMIKNLSSTEYEPNLFLKFSGNFDMLIKDVSQMKETLDNVLYENSTDIVKENPSFVAAWKHVLKVVNHSNEGAILRKFLTKVDTVLEAVKTLPVFDLKSLHVLWENYLRCSNQSYMDDDCKEISRATWMYTFKFSSVTLKDVSKDMLKYFREVNEPNATIFQALGFTKNTGLFILYEKLTDFVGVLLNSYWDLNFMNQVRRASKSQFWDCEALVDTLVIPPGSLVTSDEVQKIKPYVCPSILYWISLPRGENTLLDVVAKPQYYFFNTQVKNLSSSFEEAYMTTIELTKLLTNLSHENITIENPQSTLETKLENIVNNVLSWRLVDTDSSYQLFNDINKKQAMTAIYLTRVTTVIKKIADGIDGINISDINEDLSQNDTKKLETDLSVLQKLFRRRPTDFIALHFDLVTDAVWQDDENYTLVDSIRDTCENLKTNISKNILNEGQRTKTQICSKNYELIYGAIEEDIETEMLKTKYTLYDLISILENSEEINSTMDIFDYLNHRIKVVKAMKQSIKHSDDLGLAIYLKYLHSTLDHYNVVLSFLAGEDWWTELKDLYNGPYAKSFLGIVEKSFEIAEDIMIHLDKIHIVRLLRDINFNNTETFCLNNITLSDYLPDATGSLSLIKNQMCNIDSTDLFKELPLLTFASQGYDNKLKLSKEINYTAIELDIEKLEEKLHTIEDGPKTPISPYWVQEEKLKVLKQTILKLFSKESITKIAFGVASNMVDASTLFLNNSQCSQCSSFTTWLKQINLQLFKKQEYDNLLCHLHEMPPQDIYQTLKNDFHWDMAIKELISTRNYTKYELNKSINAFLEQVELHLLEDMLSNSTKLADCLVRDISKNIFGNATLFVSVVSKSLQLIRLAMPHLHEIDGIKSVAFLATISKEISPNIHVEVPIEKILTDKSALIEKLKQVDENIPVKLEGAMVDLLSIQKKPLSRWLHLANDEWRDFCNLANCTFILKSIGENVNRTIIEQKLPILQMEKFWTFDFISNILHHIEKFLMHISRLLGVASKYDVMGLYEGRIVAVLNFILQTVQDETLQVIEDSLQGMMEDLEPLLKETVLEFDIRALFNGLKDFKNFKESFITNGDLKVDVSQLFVSKDRIESRLESMGINNTNFWSIAAPRVEAGHIDLKPLLTTKSKEINIKNFVCQSENMSKVIIPANVDVVTLDDIYGAIIEQFCDLSDERAKEIIPILIENLNYTFILEKVMDIVLTEVYLASNLTKDEGAMIFSRYRDMMALIPTIQDNVGNLTDTLSKEPLFAALKESSSLNNLLSSSTFLESAGNMMCGSPFAGNDNRFYKAIAETKDFSTEVDPMQIEVLPTDFCRSLYKDILSMNGGKIVWSFVKPLIMGKVLYTPPSPIVTRIIEKANSSFAVMSKMADIVHSFANSFDSVESLSEHKNGIAVLRNIMNSAAFREMLKSFTGEEDSTESVEIDNVDIDDLFDNFGDLKGIGGLLKRASDLLRCINLNRFHAMSTEAKLTNEAVKLTRVNEFSAGLVFMAVEQYGDNPINVEYKIRMDIDSVPTTTRKRNQFWTPGPEASFLEDMRYFRGFVQIQDMVDKAIIQVSTNASRRITKRDVTSAEHKYAVYTQQIPYPCYRRDYFQSSLYESQALIVALFFSLILTVSSAIRFIVSEKESGNTMLMSVMGVKLSNQAFSWFVASFTEMFITVTGMFAALKLGGVLPHSDPLLLWIIMLNFGFSVVMFCYMLSKLFTSASLGAVCAVLAYLVTFMPYVIILSLEAALTNAEKLITSLSMSTAFCYSMLFVTRYEAIGVGANWNNVWNSPDSHDSMSIASTSVIVLFDSILYFIIACLIDKFFGPKTMKTNINNCTTSSEKAGVSIVNITKIYAQRSRKPKVALDNVSIELHRGQITTLLGHNGAGKTTLIKIITGMLKPSKGHVVVRTDSSDNAATRLGVCPQHDVLFENMTTVEHLTMYAQLKSGLPLDDVKHEIQNMLQVLSFGALAYEQARRLSGGLRRRLCVALAFISQPQLVLLDEPSSGVDPLARRDIWSLIVKLKEDRTVLLTTHHLDEAELLSDQIVIMHKGQIHTIGSPIEIKRSLGNGYKLTVTYPEKYQIDMQEEEYSHVWQDKSENNKVLLMEERTKYLLSVVREVVKNAQLEEIHGNEIEMLIPFFDANGLNNDFLQLCTTMESKKEALGYSSYSLDCSSLEQVFFNICQQADHDGNDQIAIHSNSVAYDTMSSHSSKDTPSKSTSSNSFRDDKTPLVPEDGEIKGSNWDQYLALLHKRWLHYSRNYWLLFLLLVLPTLFVTISMGFSLIRPPADNEIALKLHPSLYEDSTKFLIPNPTLSDNSVDQEFAQKVMSILTGINMPTKWTPKETPKCECSELRQECNNTGYNETLPKMLLLPNTSILNDWLLSSQEMYIEKRYGGWSSNLKNNISNLIAWYNNKGHHAMPSYVNSLNSAILRAVTGHQRANITTYTHPLKISEEQLSKSTVLQHIADVGISGMLLLAVSLIPAGAAIYLVSERTTQQKRLQLLCGVSPALYWFSALTWDMIIMSINIILTTSVLVAFGLPVFVARENLPAICILLFLFGFSCNSLIHVLEKLFTDASLANMVLFCGNVFLGLSGLAVLLILDIISESEATDNARWTLHKLFMLSPPFALGDALVEIAKNTVQAQVLSRFGMDTYKSPLSSDLIAYHCLALVLVGIFMLSLNLAIEYNYFDNWICRKEPEYTGEMEDMEVAAERSRVELSFREIDHPVRLQTIGNINAGFVDTEGKKNTLKQIMSPTNNDVAQCVALSRAYTGLVTRVALKSLSLGIPPGQCTALLGQNGAGKSTTFGLLVGELRPTAGHVVLNGQTVTQRQLCSGLISYCPQSDAIDPLLTVQQTLEFYCKLRGISGENEVIKRTLHMFELHKYAQQQSRTLSGGNKRKLCTAIAFMGRAPLVLLDEPTSGMDPGSRACVARGVRSACASRRGVLLSTHALDDARALARRVALLRGGSLCALAPLDRCLQRFGYGHVVSARVERKGAARVWSEVKQRAPHAQLRSLHHNTLQFLIPARATVKKKEVNSNLSDVFRLMATLQGACDVDDYTINASSLDQMFLNFSDKRDQSIEFDTFPNALQLTNEDDLDTVTSL